uniref:Uncharacterized protein n=1 Tax=Panagrellus redivivus TaxID=6233 RepID=A0A7E4VGX8_PANRE
MSVVVPIQRALRIRHASDKPPPQGLIRFRSGPCLSFVRWIPSSVGSHTRESRRRRHPRSRRFKFWRATIGHCCVVGDLADIQ